MKLLTQRFFCLLLSCIFLSMLFTCQVFSDEATPIFNWDTCIDQDVEGVIPVPHAVHYPHDWESLYNDQYDDDGIIALMLRYSTGPYDGTKSDALDTVMEYLDTEGYYLNFVFADFESETQDENCEEMVDQVRAHSNSAINNAYIGNYDEYPGATDYSHLRAHYDRTDRHNFYINSGMDVAMPVLYPYTAYRNHSVSTAYFGTNLCVSIAHALFWTPLEKYSTAKNTLPSGHILIPWIGGLVLNDGYAAPIPSKAECRALLQHVRLRGTDGYYTWSCGANTNYSDDSDYRDDMYANAWKPLNWFFEKLGKKEILNLTTNKTGGVEWSGMRIGNHCLFTISNYTTSSAQVDLPDTIENIPDLSPSVGAGGHMTIDYVIGPKSYWELDENTGTNIFDETDADNDGTISGATWTNGKFGSALSFDGTDDEVNFGDTLDIGTSDRSISLWFKTSTNDSTSRVLLSKGYSRTNNQHAIYLVNGKIYCLMDVSGTDRIVNTGATVSDGNWHNIILTIERSDEMKLYLDGDFEDSVDISADAAVDAQNSYVFYLGRSHSGQYFDSVIDDVKIFSGTLSEQDVYDEYAAIFNVRLDERQNTTVYDSSPAEYSGTVTNTSWITGMFGSALTFDGVNPGVNFGDILDIGTSDRSISLWFKTSTNDSTARVLLSKGYSRTNNQHAIYLVNGEIYCLMDVSGTDRIVNTGATVSDGNWHNITLTIERSDEMKLYLDGDLEDSVDISADATVDAQNGYVFYLGRSHNGQYFNSSIDEVKIYANALDSTQVTALNESYK
jgi:Concanavalin A-like lectin/glucanases superfamily